MQRRQFIRKAAITVVTITGMTVAAAYLRQLFPRLAGERRRITIGDPRQYPVDTFTYLKEHNLFVYRDHEGIRAVSAVCTHLGCILGKTTDGFECPCHGSCYNRRGEVVSGPAPRSLSWYLVQMAADGRIMIDPGKTVRADDKYITS